MSADDEVDVDLLVRQIIAIETLLPAFEIEVTE